MNVFSLDCEFNQPSQKTIEIGAAAYKALTGELIETFHTYVNPGEPISQTEENNIIKLTGVTDELVKDAPKILEAYLMLKEFRLKHKCFRNPIVWGSGERNDSSHLWHESGIQEENFMGYRVIDAKVLCQSQAIVQNKTIKGGLETYCNRFGIGFEGKPHGALADAINTFRIWHFMVQKLKT